jgi:hypothetical protein
MFDSEGKKKFRFLYRGIPSEEYSGPEVFPLDIHADPSEGSNLNSYVFNISRTHIECCDHPFNIFLEIQDHDGKWQNVAKGHWNLKNITFKIEDLNFTEPLFGNIKYKFKIGNGERYIGPFLNGPDAYIAFKEYKNLQAGIYYIDVKSDRCDEPICFKDKNNCNQIYGKQYIRIVVIGKQ